MSQTLVTPQQEQGEKYFSFQIKGWTNFDPMNKTLANIAAGIEEANGFMTGVEVLKIEDDLASIEDKEAREGFANTLAARRLLRNVQALPKSVVGDLRSALKTEGGVPLETVASEPMSLLNDEPVSTARPWL